MLVTNLSAHCFVLSAGVIITPANTPGGAVTVDDSLYRSDSTLNVQIDSLQAQDLISITSKPSDPFQPARTINASGQVAGPLQVEGSDPTLEVFAIVGAEDQTSDLFGVQTQDADVFGISAQGAIAATPQDPDAAALGILAAPGAALAPLYVFDNTGVYGVQVGDGVATDCIQMGGNGTVNLITATYDTDGQGDMGTAFVVGPEGQVFLHNVPTVDPHVPGQVWSSTGTLKVSAGP